MRRRAGGSTSVEPCATIRHVVASAHGADYRQRCQAGDGLQVRPGGLVLCEADRKLAGVVRCEGDCPAGGPASSDRDAPDGVVSGESGARPEPGDCRRGKTEGILDLLMPAVKDRAGLTQPVVGGVDRGNREMSAVELQAVGGVLRLALE